MEDAGTLKSVSDRVLSDPSLSRKNAQHIENHVAFLQSKGSHIRTVIKYFYHLRRFYRLLKNPKKDFKELTKEDMQYAMAKLETSDYSPETKRNVKACIKGFWKHLKGDDEFYPAEVRWLKTTQDKKHRKLPTDLLSEEEIRRMIEAAKTPRNKAFIAMLYDSGGRIGELLNMTKKSVNLDSYPAHILLDGKTGPRQIPIMFSGPYIGNYMNTIKEKPLDDALWTTYNNGKDTHRKADYATLAKVLKETAIAAGITKRIHPHLFRHSRASNYANKLTEQRLKYYFGWTGDSKMASVYVHLSGRDIDNAILEANGIRPPENQGEAKLKSKVCPKCQFSQNMATNDYCGRCSNPLDINVVEMIERNKSLAVQSAADLEVTDEFMERWIRQKYLGKKGKRYKPVLNP